MATNLTNNFTLEELYASSTAKAKGIVNLPTPYEVANLKRLCEKILQPLRTWWGKPIKIGSGYRCRTLNKLVGGAANSQHLYGMAADLCINGDISKAHAWFDWIKNNCEFDQLIMEHNAKGTYWVHVSYREGNNRKCVINNLLKK